MTIAYLTILRFTSELSTDAAASSIPGNLCAIITIAYRTAAVATDTTGTYT
jgi:hypothetical protein